MKTVKSVLEAHQPLVVDVVLPILIEYANRLNTDIDEVLLGCFLSFGVFVQMRGYRVDQLLDLIKDAYVAPHEAPEGLQ
jgi:hypothetical protein